MVSTPEWWPTQGLVGGLCIQVVDGRWDRAVGAGLAFNEAAIDLIEPHISASCAGWSPERRYGVFELSSKCRTKMSVALRHSAHPVFDKLSVQGRLFSEFAD
ncbi:hypothetical protein [Sphingopyxis sp. Geo48]|uniref:hypothetical protein n=1 Tax=Sphingopyxis sp. Geo48 TaxID=545241 RepID=UPI0024B6FB71|nr:hypothetical protein [Sphingopyxis sp. Geo48]